MTLDKMIAIVNKRQTELAELRGQKNQLLKQMEEEGCQDFADLEAEITKEERNIRRLDKQIEKEMESLEANYDWQ